MRYLLMIAAFMLMATTPLFAQKGEVAPQPAPAPVEGEEKPADSDKGEEAGEEGAEEAEENELIKQAKKLEAMFKGIDKLLDGTKVTQEGIDSFIKHNESFDKASDSDKMFEDQKDVNLVDAYNHAVKQDWFKKWATDNKVEAPEQWLKITLRVMTASFLVNTVPQLEGSLKELADQVEILEGIKETAPEEYKDAMKTVTEAQEGIEAMVKSFDVIPEIDDAETKLVEKNAEAIGKAMDNDSGDEEEDMG
ncbi:MAG: hypothetical protein L3J82_08570 [Planctomycetes bacterium]|nr:hypothetical protein [Planctomycetota bacterium]